ncbi:MAG: hypothetical protein JO218_03205 [Burkholderiales bacterium]|nr:hypothetical protein [Burkholderiales bacterium]
MQSKSKKLFKHIAIVSALAVSLPSFALTVKGYNHAHKGKVAVERSVKLKPSGKGFAVADTRVAARPGDRIRVQDVTPGANGIDYNGGPIMSGNTNVYYIWYGDWSSNTKAQQVLVNFMSSIGGTPLYNVNTTYYDNTNAYVANQVTLAGQANDSYSQGTSLDDNAVLAVVQNAISNGAVPLDPNASYMVLTSPDVNETSGFGSQYCGWHNHATVSGTDVKYAFIGNPTQIAPDTCGVNTPSPNGDGGADAMASVIFHELSETVSDPDITAWFDSTGAENGDKCAWNWGTTYTAANGSTANQNIGGSDWLLQQMWLNANGGQCAQSY